MQKSQTTQMWAQKEYINVETFLLEVTVVWQDKL